VEYLQAARQLADKYGALLIFDEVQTGVGRTGTLWAYQQYGVVPDVMTLAKGLGGGVPIGACLARGKAAETLKPGDHGSTFAGNPLVTTAANAVLDILADEGLTKNAEKMGRYLTSRLENLARQFPEILGTVRGKGLLLGIEIKPALARSIVKTALTNGLILNATDDNTLRLLPPLTINAQDVDHAIQLLTETLSSAEYASYVAGVF